MNPTEERLRQLKRKLGLRVEELPDSASIRRTIEEYEEIRFEVMRTVDILQIELKKTLGREARERGEAAFNLEVLLKTNKGRELANQQGTSLATYHCEYCGYVLGQRIKSYIPDGKRVTCYVCGDYFDIIHIHRGI
jgi:hypothetical protein